MPATLLVTLQLDAPAPQSVHVPLHALTYQLVANASASLGRQLHSAQLNPLSQHTARQHGFGGILGIDRQTVQLRVNCLLDSLVPALMDAFAPGLPLPADRDAQLHGSIVGQVMEQQCFENLAALLPAQELQMRFHTPTVLRSAGEFQSRPRPGWVYHGLLRRWNTFSPSPFPEQVWGHLTDDLRSLEERTRPLTLAVPGSARSGTLRAFTGSITVALARPRALAPFQALSAMARFAGVGAKTLYGFGAVEATVSTSGSPGAAPHG